MANVAPRTPMTAPFEVSEAPLRFMEDPFNVMYLSRTEQSVSRLTFLPQIHRRELRHTLSDDKFVECRQRVGHTSMQRMRYVEHDLRLASEQANNVDGSSPAE